jgi:hypothetical protein
MLNSVRGDCLGVVARRALLSMVILLALWLVPGFQRAGHEDIRARPLSNRVPRATTDIPRVTDPSTPRVAGFVLAGSRVRRP